MPQLGRNTRPEYSRVPSAGALATMVEPEQAMIKNLSEQQSWFIYNVSPWRYAQSMGSLGSMVIPGLDEALLLGDKGTEHEFAVAGPLVIPGMPSETYPNERKADRTYFQWWEKDPGYKLALAVCDAGDSNKAEDDLRRRGVFVSQIAERYRGDKGELLYRAPSKPVKGDSQEKHQQWATFCAQVKVAQKALREHCEHLCGYARRQASEKKEFNINERHFQAAHMLHKTTAQESWLAGSSEATTKEPCAFCGEPVKSGAAFCPSCRQQIVSDQQLQVLKDKIQGKTAE